MPSTQVFSGSFEACRNDECYEAAAFEQSNASNVYYLEGTGASWTETSVSLSYGGNAPSYSLHLSWTLRIDSKEFSDGDRYTLKWFDAAGEASTLIDTALSYDYQTVCGSQCVKTFVELAVPIAGPTPGAGGAASD